MFFSNQEVTVNYLRWKEGLRILFVDDVKGAHSGHGHGSTESPVHIESITAGLPDTGGYSFELETTDGKTASVHLDGQAIDLSNGTLFVIKARGRGVDVHQLKRDLTTIPFDHEACREPVLDDPEIRRLLGLDDSRR